MHTKKIIDNQQDDQIKARFRKFGKAIGRPLLAIGIKAIGRLFGRATSLGDRRLLLKIAAYAKANFTSSVIALLLASCCRVFTSPTQSESLRFTVANFWECSRIVLREGW